MHWRRRQDAWKQALDNGMFEHFPGDTILVRRQTISDWTVFWLTVGLAVAIAGIGWVTS